MQYEIAVSIGLHQMPHHHKPSQQSSYLAAMVIEVALFSPWQLCLSGKDFCVQNSQ
jgi:hypothetical protein